MKKIFFIFLLISVTNIANAQNTVLKKSSTNAQTSLNKVALPTNKDAKNDEWNNNVYRNKFYKFRIEFPKDWEYDNGSTKITLSRAINRKIGAAFSVTAYHLNFIPKNPNDIKSIYDFTKEDYKKLFYQKLALQNKKIENLKIAKGYLNNFPAVLTEFTHEVLSGTRSFIYVTMQIECLQNSVLFIITLNVPVGFYDDDMAFLYQRVVDSFNFEISY